MPAAQFTLPPRALGFLFSAFGRYLERGNLANFGHDEFEFEGTKYTIGPNTDQNGVFVTIEPGYANRQGLILRKTMLEEEIQKATVRVPATVQIGSEEYSRISTDLREVRERRRGLVAERNALLKDLRKSTSAELNLRFKDLPALWEAITFEGDQEKAGKAVNDFIAETPMLDYLKGYIGEIGGSVFTVIELDEDVLTAVQEELGKLLEAGPLPDEPKLPTAYEAVPNRIWLGFGYAIETGSLPKAAILDMRDSVDSEATEPDAPGDAPATEPEPPTSEAATEPDAPGDAPAIALGDKVTAIDGDGTVMEVEAIAEGVATCYWKPEKGKAQRVDFAFDQLQKAEVE